MHYTSIIPATELQTQENPILLTANHHHGHRENLLPISGGRYVPKSYRGKACHGKVERGYVQGVFAGPSFPLARARGVVAVRGPDAQGQLVQPTVRLDGVGQLIYHLVVPNAVPDAGQPVGHQPEHTHQQHQHGSTVLQVMVQLPGHPAQPQKAHHF